MLRKSLKYNFFKHFFTLRNLMNPTHDARLRELLKRRTIEERATKSYSNYEANKMEKYKNFH